MLKPLSVILFSLSFSAMAFELGPVETTLPWVVGERKYGDVKVKILGEEVEALEKRSLNSILKKTLRPEFYDELNLESEWVSALDIPFAIDFDPEQLVLKPHFQQHQVIAEVYSLTNTPHQRYGDVALKPSSFGGAINYQIQQNFGSNQSQQETTAFIDSFFNYSGFVLESQFHYQKKDDGQEDWLRGDTRLVKDLVDQRTRVELGDVNPSSFGFMRSSRLGGAMVSRRFSIDPYNVPFSQGEGEFIVRSRSEVRTYVNGMLVRNEVLPAGNYNLRDLPLVNGINQVRVEIIDDFGQKQVYEYSLPVSISILSENEMNFSLSTGRPFQDLSFNRNYKSNHLTSGFFQYGLTDNFSSGLYAQNISDFNLYGKESGLATNYGNFFVGLAGSSDDQSSGQASSLTWQFQNMRSRLFGGYTLTLRQENFTKDFKSQRDEVLTGLKSRTQANITMPLLDQLTATLGTNLSSYRGENVSKARGWDLNLNWRVLGQTNLNMFFSRTRDRFESVNETAFVFLTWSFGSSAHLVSAFHDVKNSRSRLNVIRDNQNKIYSPRVNASIEESNELDRAEIDASVRTPYAELGGRLRGSRRLQDHETKKTRYSGSARLASAFVFAHDGEQFGLGISRPIRNSYALFTSSEELRDQKVSLHTTSVHAESESGFFGELTATNLTPYQYREIRIDPSNLEPGLSLEKESFVLYPKYKSVHLVHLKEKGVLSIQGQLVDQFGEPFALSVGSIGGEIFFTDRQGEFYLEGVSAGEYEVTLRDSEESITLEVPVGVRGVQKFDTMSLRRGAEF